jgi:ubiquinone/menaquinone biosynthesis C-methylase UbiE
MTTDRQKYYQSYEDRYRRVYAQGVEHWTGDPEEIAIVVGQLDEFLAFIGATPASACIIEFGCGEGFVGEYLLRKGYSYSGVDISPSALEKARSRIPEHDRSFILGDITRLPDVQSESFDIALDNYCLQMLVTDEDRRRYLAEVHRVLKPGGSAWFREIGQRDRFTDHIESLDDFLAKRPTDLCACEAREAYSRSGKKTIQLPRVPARFNNCEGYREEIRAVGFDVTLAESKKDGIVVYVRKPGEIAEQSSAPYRSQPRDARLQTNGER